MGFARDKDVLLLSSYIKAMLSFAYDDWSSAINESNKKDFSTFKF
jgi:hypothetical protein